MEYARKSRLSWRRVGTQTIVVDPETKRLYGLNDAAGVIWHALDGAKTTVEITSLFDAVDEAAGIEIEAFLTILDREGLVERGPAADSRTDAPSEFPDMTSLPWSPPEVSWREEIQTFARGCAFHPGENVLCNISPRS